MDQPTLEYLSKNLEEFVAGLIVGSGIGYASSRFGNKGKLVDKPEFSQLGYATLASLALDPFMVGLSKVGIGSDTSIMKAAQGDIGSMLGWYVGFHTGKAVDKGLNRLYRNRNLEATIERFPQ